MTRNPYAYVVVAPSGNYYSFDRDRESLEKSYITAKQAVLCFANRNVAITIDDTFDPRYYGKNRYKAELAVAAFNYIKESKQEVPEKVWDMLDRFAMYVDEEDRFAIEHILIKHFGF